MCGVYGHEARHKKESLGIFDLSWKQKDRPRARQGRVLATGHSCRSQVHRSLGFSPLHPVEALLSVLSDQPIAEHALEAAEQGSGDAQSRKLPLQPVDE